MHSIRMSGTISIHVGPSQIQMIGLRHQRKKDQKWPLYNGDQLNGVEVNSLQVASGPFVSEDGRHYHWVQDLDNQLVEQLRYIGGAAVEADCGKVKHACENELRRQIVKNIDDCTYRLNTRRNR